MSKNPPMVNAWMMLQDEPEGTNYFSPTSCYQALIKNNVYQSISVLFVCFVKTVQLSDGTWTIEIPPGTHPGNLTSQEYLQYVVSDARAQNAGINISVTLGYENGRNLSQIFADPSNPDEASAASFAANVMTFLQENQLNGFDLDWEAPLSRHTTRTQFQLIANALGAQFQSQTEKYYLTISPAVAENLDAAAVNANVDFINLQLYSGFTFPGDFTGLGIDASLFAYGVNFVNKANTATNAHSDNLKNYRYPIYTCWQLNPADFDYTQGEVVELNWLVFPIVAEV